MGFFFNIFRILCNLIRVNYWSRGCKDKGTLLNCWWECKSIQPTENGMKIPLKTRYRTTIQPSHPLSSPFPPAPNPSQHQSLFQWINSSHEVGQSTGVSALTSFLPKNIQDWSPLEWTGWMRWLDGITDSMDVGLGELLELVDGQGGLALLQFMELQRVRHDWATELNW